MQHENFKLQLAESIVSAWCAEQSVNPRCWLCWLSLASAPVGWAIEEGPIQERFRFHDIRAAVITAVDEANMDAQVLAGYKSGSMTEAYIRSHDSADGSCPRDETAILGRLAFILGSGGTIDDD